MAKSNWNKMSTWYDGMVGEKGHKYHTDYAIPAVMDMMNLNKSSKVLDVGCGQGALAPYVKRAGGNYFGVDISSNLINAAMKRHKSDGKFFTVGAADISKLPEIKDIRFDYIVFMLSIQDMDPIETILPDATKLLNANGSLIIFMMHPAFRIPRQSGWGEDKNRKLIYRRVDRYLTTETIPLNTHVVNNGKSITSYFYHRPLSKYFEEFKKCGLRVGDLFEIAEDKKGYAEFPTFLALMLVKSS